MADALPQAEPSDDFKAGWDKAIAVAANLITPKQKPATGDHVTDVIQDHTFAVAQGDANAIRALSGQYQFRHLRDAQ